MIKILSKNKNVITIYFTIVAILFVTIRCNTLKGHNGISNNINESKERRVFVHEYHVLTNPYPINDTLKINVKKAWLEKKWKYDDNYNSEVVISGYQLIVEVNEEDIVGIDFDWTIGVSGDKYFRKCSKNSIVSDFISLPKSKEIVYKVQSGRNLTGKVNSNRIIGQFIIEEGNSAN